MAVGDINSNEKGSGARFNDGKPQYHLLPLHVLGRYLLLEHGRHDLRVQAIAMLSLFQARIGNDAENLMSALSVLGTATGNDYPEGLEDAVRVFEYGAKKYAAWNWAKGMKWSIPIECCVRHLLADLTGEPNDPESGYSHLGHAQCNIIMLLLYLDVYPEGDDRPERGVLVPERITQELAEEDEYDIDWTMPEALRANPREEQAQEIEQAYREFQEFLEGELNGS